MRSTLPVSPQVIAAECLCLGVQRAARVVARHYDEALRPVALSNGQFSLLASVAGLQPVGMQALAEHLAMDRTTVTAALKPLARRGLVSIEVAAHDLRAREVSLTKDGFELLRQATALWTRAQQASSKRLGGAARAPMLAALHRLL